MEIPAERIGKLLEIYRPEWRFLKLASADFPSAEAWFKIGETPYASRPLEHITELEMHACINQAGYAAFSQWMDEGRIGGIHIPFDDFYMLANRRRLVIECRALKTPQSIASPVKKKPIAHGKLTLGKYRKIGELYLARADFDMDYGKDMRKLEYVISLNAESPKR